MSKTDNLSILMTDIVGFTESTSKQTRSEQRHMMSRHDRIMYPLITRFQGRLVKSYGDGLLATFRSPTNAMRCAMAIQDGLTDFNATVDDDDRIEVRVAVNVGEVRVENADIFGEAVNLTARVESLVPAGEVYFTEAVYLAMNKAEIAAESLGSRELKGIPEKVSIYRVPQHATHRLVTSGELEAESNPMPYGGMHLLRDEHANNTAKAKLVAAWAKRPSLSAMLVRIPEKFRAPVVASAVVLIVLLAASVSWIVMKPFIATTASVSDAVVEADSVGGRQVEEVSADQPAQSSVHIAQANQYLASNERKLAAEQFGLAFDLDPTLADDERHAKSLVSCLSWGAEAAEPVITRHLSDAVVAALIERTTQSGQVGARRALKLLEVSGRTDLLDREAIALQMLSTSTSCGEKAKAANDLAIHGSDTAIPALKKLRGSKLALMFKWECGRAEADDAIKAITARSAQ